MQKKKEIKILKKVLLLAFLNIFLLACGGGSGSSSSSSAGIGIDGTGKTITVSGSINESSDVVVINNTTFDVGGAQASIDGVQSETSDLSLGQVVLANGKIKDGSLNATAEQIFYHSNVIGFIDAIDQADTTIKALGQTVLIDDTTIFGDNIDGFDELENFQAIRVSGFVDSEKNILASRIDMLESLVNYQVIGVVDAFDLDNMTFNINDLVIHYGGSNIENMISDGDNVKVIGVELLPDGSLTADEIELLPFFSGSAETLVDVGGLITQFTDKNNFSVAGFNIVSNDATEIENGGPDGLDDLGLDARIDVLGKFNAQGEVVANMIRIIHLGPQRRSGFLSPNTAFTFVLNSTDADTALWVSLADLDGGAGLIVATAAGEPEPLVCRRLELSILEDGLCYLENKGATQWEITIEAYQPINYNLVAYFRRAPLLANQVLDIGSSTEVLHYAGDRNRYQLSTSNAPAGSFLAVSIEGLGDGSELTISSDGQLGAGDPNCRLGGFNSRTTCWLDNNGVDEWTLLLDSAADGQYTLHVDFVVPNNIAEGSVSSATITRDQGMLYHFDLPSNVTNSASVSMLLSGLNEPATLFINPSMPATLLENTCDLGERFLGHPSTTDEQQCIVLLDSIPTNGTRQWYVVVKGQVGASYDLSVQLQNQQPAMRTLALDDRIQTFQSAGQVATYRIAAGAVGSVFVAGVNDLDGSAIGAANFEIEIKRDPQQYVADCMVQRFITDRRLCRVLNQEGVTDWYVTVRSARSGNYELWVKEQPLVDISVDVSAAGTITNDTVDTGVLYRFSPSAVGNRYLSELSNKTNLASLTTKLVELPVTNSFECGLAQLLLDDEVCHVFAYEPGFSYLLVNGVNNANYVLTIRDEQ